MWVVAGGGAGVLANAVFPNWLITLMLTLLLFYITFLAVRKAVTLHRSEMKLLSQHATDQPPGQPQKSSLHQNHQHPSAEDADDSTGLLSRGPDEQESRVAEPHAPIPVNHKRDKGGNEDQGDVEAGILSTRGADSSPRGPDRTLSGSPLRRLLSASQSLKLKSPGMSPSEMGLPLPPSLLTLVTLEEAPTTPTAAPAEGQLGAERRRSESREAPGGASKGVGAPEGRGVLLGGRWLPQGLQEQLLRPSMDSTKSGSLDSLFRLGSYGNLPGVFD